MLRGGRCVSTMRRGVPRQIFFYSIPGVHMRTVAIDPAHTLDKGVTSLFVGSLLHDLIFDKVLEPNGTIPQQCGALWGRVQRLYEELQTQTRLSRFSLDMICDPSKPHTAWPCLNTKMAMTRSLVPVAARLAQQYSTGSRWDLHRVEAARHLERAYALMLEGGFFFTDEEHASLKASVGAFLLHYSWLSNDAGKKGLVKYNLTMKFHYLSHMADDSEFMNPRLGTTYQDEDFVGRLAKAGKASVKANKLTQVCATVAQRYALGLAARFSGNRGLA